METTQKDSNNKRMFLSFFKIGAFTLGGGYAMLPIMEREVVDKYNWLSREEFMNIIGVSLH